MAKGDAKLKAALLAYVKELKEQGLTPTFAFGDYGERMHYGTQPCLASLVDNRSFLLKVLPSLKKIYRRSTIVRETFLEAKHDYKEGNLNVSSFDDRSWSRWCAAAAILLTEHLHKIAFQSRVYRQVLLQDTHGEGKQVLDELLTAYSDSCPTVIKTELEPDVDSSEADHANTSCPNAFLVSTDWQNFNGGRTLKACLMQATVEAEEQSTDEEVQKETEEQPAHDEVQIEAEKQSADEESLLAEAIEVSSRGSRKISRRSAAATCKATTKATCHSKKTAKGKAKGTAKGKANGTAKGKAKGTAKGKGQGKATGKAKAATSSLKRKVSNTVKPPSFVSKFGRISLIQGVDRAYVSCANDKHRKQWLQVSSAQIRRKTSVPHITPLAVVMHVFSCIRDDGLDKKAAMQLKDEILDGLVDA